MERTRAASDSISHKSLLSALEQRGIESQYVSLLRKLYAEQKATVLTDKESGVFELKRGAAGAGRRARDKRRRRLRKAAKRSMWREI